MKEIIDELAIEMSNIIIIEISDKLLKETSSNNGRLKQWTLKRNEIKRDEPLKEMKLKELGFNIVESLEETYDLENFK